MHLSEAIRLVQAGRSLELFPIPCSLRHFRLRSHVSLDVFQDHQSAIGIPHQAVQLQLQLDGNVVLSHTPE